MSVSEIYRAWVFLLALSFVTTALTVLTGLPAPAAVGLLLMLSGIKARTIIGRYLELRSSNFWMKVFDLVIGLFLLIAFLLFVVGSARTS